MVYTLVYGLFEMKILIVVSLENSTTIQTALEYRWIMDSSHGAI